MRRGDGVRGLFARPWFASLYGARTVAQSADGIFQASLASAVFFNPEHQTDPRQAAAGFVILLLPYSLVGPFAGVLLDRWRRQAVLARANVVRAGLVMLTATLLIVGGPRHVSFYLAALATLSVSRFYLAALSASLPHVVAREQLVLANAVTTTSGSVVSATGAGIGLRPARLRRCRRPRRRDRRDVRCGRLPRRRRVAARMPRDLLGSERPPPVDSLSHSAATRRRRPACRRSAYRPAARCPACARRDQRHPRAVRTVDHRHIAALPQLLPRRGRAPRRRRRAGSSRRGRNHRLPARRSGHAGDRAADRQGAVDRHLVRRRGCRAAGLRTAVPAGPLLVGAALVGAATAGAKICVDTIVQEQVDDDYRGRVFSFYDTLVQRDVRPRDCCRGIHAAAHGSLDDHRRRARDPATR